MHNSPSIKGAPTLPEGYSYLVTLFGTHEDFRVDLRISIVKEVQKKFLFFKYNKRERMISSVISLTRRPDMTVDPNPLAIEATWLYNKHFGTNHRATI